MTNTGSVKVMNKFLLGVYINDSVKLKFCIDYMLVFEAVILVKIYKTHRYHCNYYLLK